MSDNTADSGDYAAYLREYLQLETSPEFQSRLKKDLDTPLVDSISDVASADACRLLEVGFLTGRLLLKLEEVFPHAELFGFEKNPLAVARLRTLARRATIFEGAVENPFPAEIPSDCNLMIASLVISYLSDDSLRIFLGEHLPQNLRDGGQIVLSVPNPTLYAEQHNLELKDETSRKFFDSFGGGAWAYIRTENRIARMLEECGYDIDVVTTSGISAPPPYLIFTGRRG